MPVGPVPAGQARIVFAAFTGDVLLGGGPCSVGVVASAPPTERTERHRGRRFLHRFPEAVARGAATRHPDSVANASVSLAPSPRTASLPRTVRSLTNRNWSRMSNG